MYLSLYLCHNTSIMGTLELKNIISESLNSNDIGLLQRMVEVIEHYKNNKKPSVLSNAQIEELDLRRAKHLSGKGTSYSWQEIKHQLIDKHGLQA